MYVCMYPILRSFPRVRGSSGAEGTTEHLPPRRTGRLRTEYRMSATRCAGSPPPQSTLATHAAIGLTFARLHSLTRPGPTAMHR